jgi:ubiquinone/menaquinone biosynthesis C-methylase UbiE
MELNSNELYQKVLTSGWSFSRETFFALSEYEKSFVRNEFTGLRTLDYYSSRVEQVQFTGKENILDAACGMGQWSIALAKKNKFVEGIDLNGGRIEVAKSIAKDNGVQNVNFQVGSIDNLPYSDNTFDVVFCYGSFMFTDMPKTLKEFKRVLKPGGHIYVNANGFGWYLHLIFTLGLLKGNTQLMKTAIRMIFGALSGKSSQIMVLPGYLRKLGSENLFKTVSISHEGGISLQHYPRVEPAYKIRYFGFIGIWEVIWKK